MNVIFDHSEPITDNIRTFWFKPLESVRYTAGQFIELYLEHPDYDDRGIKRWFTLSSSPTEELVSITTRRSADKTSTFKQALWKLKQGDKVKMAAPMGDFVLPLDPTVPLIFTIGGMGVTPLRSMVKWLTDTGQKRDIKLLYAAKSQSQLIFQDLFSRYGVEIETLVGAKAEQASNLFAKTLTKFHAKKPHGLMYISGPEQLVEVVVDKVKPFGITQDQLITDYFPGYGGEI